MFFDIYISNKIKRTNPEEEGELVDGQTALPADPLKAVNNKSRSARTQASFNRGKAEGIAESEGIIRAQNLEIERLRSELASSFQKGKAEGIAVQFAEAEASRAVDTRALVTQQNQIDRLKLELELEIERGNRQKLELEKLEAEAVRLRAQIADLTKSRLTSSPYLPPSKRIPKKNSL